MIGFGIFLHAAQTESLSICSGTGTLIASNRPSRPPSGASESYATLPPIHEEVQVECVCTKVKFREISLTCLTRLHLGTFEFSRTFF